MNDYLKNLPSLDEILSQVEQQELPKTKSSAPRSNDKILLSLDSKSTKIISTYNSKIIPYEFIIDRGRKKSQEIETQIIEGLHPYAQEIKKENPYSQIIFCMFEYGNKAPNISNLISKNTPNIIRKRVVNLAGNSGEELEIISEHIKNIVNSAHGYEIREK